MSDPIQLSRAGEPVLRQLPQGRWAVEVRLATGSVDTIKEEWFPAYDSLYEGLSPEQGIPNLRLRSRDHSPDRDGQIVCVYETLTSNFVLAKDPVTDYDLNGLRRDTLTYIARKGTDASGFVVGQSEYGGSPLAKKTVIDEPGATVVELVYLEPGIVDAQVQQEDGGLLLVTFRSFYSKITPTCLNGSYTLTDPPNLAFQGGAAASLFRSRVENVLGYKVYTVTSMMKSDGSALAVGSDNTIHSYQAWVEYEKPGLLDVSTNDGPKAYPGNTRWVKALIEEVLTTVSTVDNTYKPFSVTEWASYNVSYTPSDGSAPVNVSKGAHGYLADSAFSGSNTTYAGIAVDSVAAAAASDPTPSDFYALEDQVIGANAAPAFITDEGVKWYRKRRVTVVGTFGDYLS